MYQKIEGCLLPFNGIKCYLCRDGRSFRVPPLPPIRPTVACLGPCLNRLNDGYITCISHYITSLDANLTREIFWMQIFKTFARSQQETFESKQLRLRLACGESCWDGSRMVPLQGQLICGACELQKGCNSHCV